VRRVARVCKALSASCSGVTSRGCRGKVYLEVEFSPNGLQRGQLHGGQGTVGLLWGRRRGSISAAQLYRKLGGEGRGITECECVSCCVCVCVQGCGLAQVAHTR